jgi:hypothetical protein
VGELALRGDGGPPVVEVCCFGDILRDSADRMAAGTEEVRTGGFIGFRLPFMGGAVEVFFSFRGVGEEPCVFGLALCEDTADMERPAAVCDINFSVRLINSC